MPLSEAEQNKRAAAAMLLDQLDSEATPLDQKIEITAGLMRLNPEAFFHVARIHLKAVTDPKSQD